MEVLKMRRMQIFHTQKRDEIVFILYRNMDTGLSSLTAQCESEGVLIGYDFAGSPEGLATRLILALNVMGVAFLDEEERFLATSTLFSIIEDEEVAYMEVVRRLVENGRYRK